MKRLLRRCQSVGKTVCEMYPYLVISGSVYISVWNNRPVDLIAAGIWFEEINFYFPPSMIFSRCVCGNIWVCVDLDKTISSSKRKVWEGNRPKNKNGLRCVRRKWTPISLGPQQSYSTSFQINVYIHCFVKVPYF